MTTIAPPARGLVRTVPTARRPVAALEQVIGAERYAGLLKARCRLPDPARRPHHLKRQLDGRQRRGRRNAAEPRRLRRRPGHVAPYADGRLALVGPSTAEVADDPEGAAVYAECLRLWQSLPDAVRVRAMLISLPLDDVDENAAMVNALQRHATVVTQKKPRRGVRSDRGEAMWKGRPVVRSAVGGIPDQITAGTGVLLPDPGNLGWFGATVLGLLTDDARRASLGAAARERVRTAFVAEGGQRGAQGGRRGGIRRPGRTVPHPRFGRPCRACRARGIIKSGRPAARPAPCPDGSAVSRTARGRHGPAVGLPLVRPAGGR